jgi:hypothetical protein
VKNKIACKQDKKIKAIDGREPKLSVIEACVASPDDGSVLLRVFLKKD